VANYSTVTEGRERPSVTASLLRRNNVEMKYFVALACGLSLISTGNTMAATGSEIGTCTIGHRFEPGPIVNGHNRQPTPQKSSLGRSNYCCGGTPVLAPTQPLRTPRKRFVRPFHRALDLNCVAVATTAVSQ
jgi:hypothetical protein